MRYVQRTIATTIAIDARCHVCICASLRLFNRLDQFFFLIKAYFAHFTVCEVDLKPRFFASIFILKINFECLTFWADFTIKFYPTFYQEKKKFLRPIGLVLTKWATFCQKWDGTKVSEKKNLYSKPQHQLKMQNMLLWITVYGFLHLTDWC